VQWRGRRLARVQAPLSALWKSSRGAFFGVVAVSMLPYLTVSPIHDIIRFYIHSFKVLGDFSAWSVVLFDFDRLFVLPCVATDSPSLLDRLDEMTSRHIGQSSDVS
jgi:hypothetical protein